MIKVAILLATWNSSRYLGELLDSILTQTYTDWELHVRDDGSTDNTLEILANYAHKDSRIQIVSSRGNMGPKMGFMNLLEQVEAELYMFCDHDDVWFPSKIEDSVNLMCSQPDWKSKPLVVGTDLCVVDAQLNVLADSFWKQQHYALSLCNNKYFHLVYNNIPGCTMLFNQLARKVALPCPQEAQMHDSWLVASVLWNGGRVLPLAMATIFYRQHQDNVLGATQVPSYYTQLKRLRQLFHKTKKEWHAVRHIANLGFLRFFIIKMYYMILLHHKS